MRPPISVQAQLCPMIFQQNTHSTRASARDRMPNSNGLEHHQCSSLSPQTALRGMQPTGMCPTGTSTTLRSHFNKLNRDFNTSGC